MCDQLAKDETSNKLPDETGADHDVTFFLDDYPNDPFQTTNRQKLLSQCCPSSYFRKQPEMYLDAGIQVKHTIYEPMSALALEAIIDINNGIDLDYFCEAHPWILIFSMERLGLTRMALSFINTLDDSWRIRYIKDLDYRFKKNAPKDITIHLGDRSYRTNRRQLSSQYGYFRSVPGMYLGAGVQVEHTLRSDIDPDIFAILIDRVNGIDYDMSSLKGEVAQQLAFDIEKLGCAPPLIGRWAELSDLMRLPDTTKKQVSLLKSGLASQIKL